jgi:hypothetical protein
MWAWALLVLCTGTLVWMVGWLVHDVSRNLTAPEVDRLAQTVEVWLVDERPAWETVAAFERDVEDVLRGIVTQEPVSRMPLREPTIKRKIKAADGHTVKVREPGIKKCRHRWTTIPPSTVDAFAKIDGGRVRLPDMYVGRKSEPWCVKCRQRRDGRPVVDLKAIVRRVETTSEDDLQVVINALVRRKANG